MSNEKELGDEFEAILEDAPREKNLVNDTYFRYYQGFWIPEVVFRNAVFSQRNFVARDDDIILASCPKSGTTWLKALVFSIVKRSHFALAEHPLHKANPHDLVPTLEVDSLNTENVSQPRIIATHIPYGLLPPSIKTSSSKIVYISRNPMDQFISMWHFASKLRADNGEPRNLEACFDMFCRGVHGFGPFWDHVLGYWKASLEKPHKILILKYEDLSKDIKFNIKKLAEFLQFPFSEVEEKQGIIEEISTLCGFEKLKNLEVNKNGRRPYGMSYSAFFRKGDVGDSKNFLTSSMIERMEKLMQEKYGEYNLTFEVSL